MILYTCLALLVVASSVGMFWLKRAGEEAWRRERLRRALAPMAKDFDRMKAVIGERLIPAIRQMADEMQRIIPALERFAAAIREADSA